MIIYNILSKEKAQNTLERLTGITWSEWKVIRDGYDRDRWSYEDDYIEDVLKEKNVTLPSFYELELVFSHITTSANGCIDIRKHGLITHACQAGVNFIISIRYLTLVMIGVRLSTWKLNMRRG